MYAITHKSRPTTISRLFRIAERKLPYGYDDAAFKGYISAPRADQAIEIYLRHIGGAWHDRPKGIDVRKFEFPRMATGKGRRVDSPKIYPAVSRAENTAIVIKSSVNFRNGEILLDEDFFGEITRKVFRAREDAIYKGLIDLGWTPPPSEREM